MRAASTKSKFSTEHIKKTESPAPSSGVASPGQARHPPLPPHTPSPARPADVHRARGASGPSAGARAINFAVCRSSSLILLWWAGDLFLASALYLNKPA